MWRVFLVLVYANGTAAPNGDVLSRRLVWSKRSQKLLQETSHAFNHLGGDTAPTSLGTCDQGRVFSNPQKESQMGAWKRAAASLLSVLASSALIFPQ